MDEKKPYRIRARYRHGMNNESGPGDIVYLRDDEAAGLYFKLEAVQGQPAAMQAAVAAVVETGTLATERSLEELLGEDLAAKLNAAGIEQLTELQAASDKELEQIPGIGKATVKTIREKVG